MILTSTMEASTRQFSSCFTKPSFQTFCVIVTGWLLGHPARWRRRFLASEWLWLAGKTTTSFGLASGLWKVARLERRASR